MLDLPRALLLVAREVQSGTFTPRVESFGLASDVVRFTTDSTITISAALMARVRAAADSIAAGTLVVAGQGAP